MIMSFSCFDQWGLDISVSTSNANLTNVVERIMDSPYFDGLKYHGVCTM